jgi:hypothetical protein
MALAALSALLFGGLPALRASRPAQWSGIRVTVRSQRWLVAGEVALSFVLLVGAGLVIRAFVAIRSYDLGYDPHRVLTNFVELPPSADGSRAAGTTLYARIRERVAALPGVREVATASSIPMFGVSLSMTVEPEGAPESQHRPAASLDVISDAYFRVLRIPLRAGRSFTPEDRDGARPVAVVSESIAGRYFAGSPIGRRLMIPELKFNIDGGKEIATEIVGVAGNVCLSSVEDCRAEHIYLPESQYALRMVNLLVRTAGDPRAAASAVRHAMYQEAPAIPLDDPQTLEERTAYLTTARNARCGCWAPSPRWPWCWPRWASTASRLAWPRTAAARLESGWRSGPTIATRGRHLWRRPGPGRVRAGGRYSDLGCLDAAAAIAAVRRKPRRPEGVGPGRPGVARGGRAGRHNSGGAGGRYGSGRGSAAGLTELLKF